MKTQFSNTLNINFDTGLIFDLYNNNDPNLEDFYQTMFDIAKYYHRESYPRPHVIYLTMKMFQNSLGNKLTEREIETHTNAIKYFKSLDLTELYLKNFGNSLNNDEELVEWE